MWIHYFLLSPAPAQAHRSPRPPPYFFFPPKPRSPTRPNPLLLHLLPRRGHRATRTTAPPPSSLPAPTPHLLPGTDMARSLRTPATLAPTPISPLRPPLATSTSFAQSIAEHCIRPWAHGENPADLASQMVVGFNNHRIRSSTVLLQRPQRGGTPFCILSGPNEELPPPVSSPAGHRAGSSSWPCLNLRGWAVLACLDDEFPPVHERSEPSWFAQSSAPGGAMKSTA